MQDSSAARALAAAVFVAALAVATIAAQNQWGAGEPVERRLTLVAPFQTLAAAPDTWFTLPLTVRNVGFVAETINVSVATKLEHEVAFSGPREIGPGDATGIFVMFHLPLEGGSSIPAKITATSEGAIGVLDFVVNKQAPLGLVAAGDVAVIDYVARLEDASVAETNNAFVGTSSAFAKASPPAFQRFEPINVTAVGRSQIPGLAAAVEGMRAGESRTFLFMPDEAFGEKNVTLERERTTPIPREFTLARTVSGPRFSFRPINETSAVGDTVKLDTGLNTFQYRIVALDDFNATLSFETVVGDRYSLIMTPEGFFYPDFWPNQTVVTGLDEVNVTFRVEPEDLGAVFTWFSYWPNSSKVASVDDETIVVEHSPPVGLKYRQTTGGRAIVATVAELNSDAIVIQVENTNRFAGLNVFFDIYVRGVVHET